MSDRLLILGWHNVDGTWGFPSAAGKGAEGLRSQLRLLARVANVVDLADGVDRLQSGRPLPPRAVALTFDDGYRDNLTVALPMLEALGLPATFFLVPSLLGRDVVAWWERLALAIARSHARALEWDGGTWPLDDANRYAAYCAVAERLKQSAQGPRLDAVVEIERALGTDGTSERQVADLFLDWDEARELARRAAIGAHSRAHAILANESPDAQFDDLAHAKRDLSERLAVDVHFLAYPNGTPADFTCVTEDAAERAGYRAALTTISGWNRRPFRQFALRRQVMFPEMGVRIFKRLVKPAIADARRREPVA
jgi:peptidoglycan/xylan/chitin deacetylase (PgdA/CDA1 family)